MFRIVIHEGIGFKPLVRPPVPAENPAPKPAPTGSITQDPSAAYAYAKNKNGANIPDDVLDCIAKDPRACYAYLKNILGFAVARLPPQIKDGIKKDPNLVRAVQKRINPEQEVFESAVDDEDVHLQSAHDALSSRITKCKRDGKDCKALEARLAHIAALLKKA
jgi:hypothetical protein